MKFQSLNEKRVHSKKMIQKKVASFTERGKNRKHKEPIQVHVNINDGKDKAGKTANIISAIGQGISLILLIVTSLLLYKTIEANQISNASLSAARDAVKEATRANDIAVQSSVFSDSVSRENLKISKSSLGQQIHSITEAQRQFDVDNKPMIEIDDVKYLSFKIGEPPAFAIKIKNWGKKPAKVKIIEYSVVFGPIDTILTKPDIFQNVSVKENRILPTERDMEVQRFYRERLTKQIFEKMKNGHLFIYHYGIIQYEDIISHKNMYTNLILEM